MLSLLVLAALAAVAVAAYRGGRARGEARMHDELAEMWSGLHTILASNVDPTATMRTLAYLAARQGLPPPGTPAPTTEQRLARMRRDRRRSSTFHIACAAVCGGWFGFDVSQGHWFAAAIAAASVTAIYRSQRVSARRLRSRELLLERLLG